MPSLAGGATAKPILVPVTLRDGDVPLFFYELHESDSDIFADVLLAHDVEYDERSSWSWSSHRAPGSSTASARTRSSRPSQRTWPRSPASSSSTIRQLRVAVNVSAMDDGTFVSDITVASRGGSDVTDYRTLLVDVEPDDAVWGDDRLD